MVRGHNFAIKMPLQSKLCRICRLRLQRRSFERFRTITMKELLVLAPLAAAPIPLMQKIAILIELQNHFSRALSQVIFCLTNCLRFYATYTQFFSVIFSEKINSIFFVHISTSSILLAQSKLAQNQTQGSRAIGHGHMNFYNQQSPPGPLSPRLRSPRLNQLSLLSI